ncbi:MAG: hypothetical protein M1840_000721 [Geoglossum simile]|nr:MAG: hypothetical protein M1840_000721 [Geoglossum simile]
MQYPVCQFKQLSHLRVEGSRAVRLSSVALFVRNLVEGWCFEEDGPTQQRASISEALRQPPQGSAPNEALDVNLPALPSALPGQEKLRRLSTKAKKNMERRSQIPDGFWQLINGGRCIRKMLVVINALLLVYHGLRYLKGLAKSTPWMAAAARKTLLTWQESKASILLRSMDYIDPAVIMSEAIVKEVVRSAGNIDSVSTLHEAAGGKWAWIDEYDEEGSVGEGEGEGEGEGTGEEEVVLRSIFPKAVDGVS